MRITSVNVGQAQVLEGVLATTGIVKVPWDGPVEIKRDGVTGDAVCNRQHHGGPDQAVYVYGGDDYAYWAELLDAELAPGTFGENLTIEGLASAEYHLGDRFRIGTTVLECSTLGARMGDPRFPVSFRAAERPGLYLRVIEEGTIRAGDEVRVEAPSHDAVSILEVFRENYNSSPSVETLRRFLAAPIDIRSRTKIENTLRRMGGTP